MHRVLVLGSGYMSGPLVEYLVRDGTVAVTVASNILEQAQQLANTYKNTTAASVNVTSDTSLKALISDHELVISYVPNTLHPVVVKQCLDSKVNMVSASYVTPEIKAFHEPAIDAGITMLNEVGVDPGIDHMLAMECFDEVNSKGGKVVSFESWCGGLPHPDNADNALKYKFSWSPRTVLLAALRPARFIKDGRLNEVMEGHLLEPPNVLTFSNILPGVEMEGYYNSDSMKYAEIYNIPDAKTLIRGTLRYKGYCKVVQGMYKLGLLSLVENQRLTQGAAELRWKDLMGMLISQGDVRQPDLQSSVFHAVGKDHEVAKALEDLHLLTDEPVDMVGSPLDALCLHLQKHLQFKPGETDAIFMHHFIGIEWPDSKKEVRHIDFTVYGDPNGFSAMAKTVATPTAIAAKMILNGELKTKGVLIPTTVDIYKPILERLRDEGIGANVKKL